MEAHLIYWPPQTLLVDVENSSMALKHTIVNITGRPKKFGNINLEQNKFVMSVRCDVVV